MSVFEQPRSAFGTGGPSVDTVLDTPVVSPGEDINGRVCLQGSADEVIIGRLVVGLVVQAEVELKDSRRKVGGLTLVGAELRHVDVQRDLRLAANQRLDIPFTLSSPWETPITMVGDAVLPILVGVRTELVVHDARDTSDLDPVAVQPLPSQHRVLDAFGALGAIFHRIGWGVEKLAGVPQELSFRVRFEFVPPPWSASRLKEVRLSFVTSERDLWVYLEADKRGFRADVGSHFRLTHEDAGLTDWTSLIGNWLAAACR